MKRKYHKRIRAILFVCFLCPHTLVLANNIGQFAEFSLGMVGSSYFHELGHAGVAKLYGADIHAVRISKTQFKLPHSLSNKKKVASLRSIALAGFLTEILATELIFQNKSWHNSHVALGWMSTSIYTSLVNPFRFYILGKKKNDLAVYEKYGGDPLLPSLIMAAYAVWIIDRIQKSTQIPSELGEELFVFPVIFAVEL